MIRVSEPKKEMPIGGLNNSSSKTNRKRRIKVSNLEVSGRAVSAPKNKLWRFRRFYLLIYWDFRDALHRKFLCFFP